MQSPFIRGKIQSVLHESSVTVTVLLLQEKKEKNLQPNGAANTQRMIQETIVGQTTAKKSSYLKMTKVFQKWNVVVSVIKQTSRLAGKLGHYVDHVTTGLTVGTVGTNTLFTVSTLRRRRTHTHAHTHACPCSLFVLTLYFHIVFVCSTCVSVCVGHSLSHTHALLEGRSTVCNDPPVSHTSQPPHVCECESISVCLSRLLHANTHTVRLCFKQGATLSGRLIQSDSAVC